VPSGASRLEVRVSLPASVQYAIGVRAGTDFSTTTFNATWGGIVGENPVVITTSSSPPLQPPATYFIGILLVTNPTPATGTITATFSTGGPAISVPATFDFGPVTVGQSRDQSLRVQNTGTQTLTITSVTSSSTQFRLVSPSTPIMIAAGSQQDLTLRFEPSATGARSGTLTIRSDDPSRPTVTVALSGQGVAAAPRPAVSSVENGASFLPGISTGSWITIRGTNLASTTRIWTGADFQGNRLPVSLDGVSVKVNNRDAAVYYISPTQINALALADTALGPVSVTVTNSLGTSAAVQATYQQYAPGFFAFDPQNRMYPAAVHPDGTLAGRVGLFGNAATTAPARPGGRILLYGTGFGPVDPPADPAVVLSGAVPLAAGNNLRILIGGREAAIEFAGQVSNGLYQFNIVVPDVPDGDQTLVAEIGGQRSQTTLRLTVQGPPRPQIRYPGLTRQEALDCPGVLCKGTVTVSPGDQVDFWVAGTNLADVTGIRFLPPDGISVSQVQATGATVTALLTISADAALGKRTFVLTAPSGDSNESPGSLNISNFRISNLRITDVANPGTRLSFTVTLDYRDPTGAVSSGPLDISTWLVLSNAFIGGLGSNFNPPGRTPGATSGTITYVESYDNVRGTGAYFQIYLRAKDGRESDRLGTVF
jgi:uncharacterized protein (TIGR03437 family)